MTADGDIRHEDYQRKLLLVLENTTLNGAVVSGTCEQWNSTWADVKDMPECCWVPESEWNTPYGVTMTMNSGSVWNVTGTSTVASLTIAEGAVINGKAFADGKPMSLAAGTYENVTIEPV